MPDGRRRSREHWTDSMEAGPPDPPAHTHRLPTVVRAAVIGLTAAVLLLAAAVGLLAVYVYQQQQYIQGRGEYRDAEQQRLEERIRESVCDLLDQLPEGGLLERPRDKYHCGPGIPIAELPPDQAAQIQAQRGVTVREAPPRAPTPAAPSTTRAPGGAVEGPRGTFPPPAPASAATPTPPTATPAATPLFDRVTHPLCDALGVCVQARP